MNRLRYSLAAACASASVIITAEYYAVAGMEKEVPDPTPPAVEKGSGNLAQADSQRETNGGSKAKVNVDSQGLIVKGYDVVAYFKQGKPTKGNPAFESTYQGATYLFASSADKADFDKDPAKYAPQYGGYCSYGVANGVLADLEGPDAFAIYRGKLYLCGNQAALKEFKIKIDNNIEKASVNWRLLADP
jgi:YHS domain-containing protein